MPSPCAYFVTGTDTEIGKTLVSSALLHALAQTGMRAVGMKPVAAGAQWHDGKWRNDDVESLAAAANMALPQELTTPYLLREAAAPHIAAQLENVSINLNHIRRCYDRLADEADAIVVEGVGGFCVPLSAETDTADLARLLGLPVIMVVGLRLGCINHALLTAQAIAARGLQLAGWVANLVDAEMAYADENVAAIGARLPAPLLGVVPRLELPSAAAAAGNLDFSCLPGWPGERTNSI
ncbi:dethiobiotin synthase [Oxalobacteraceae bacterium R-40]|uniref:ATP-dependent dethiobiotin synthetase BioD n=1 Tax=Keguizhuia sedimenti TaxID=3064264 RepID=A0ABU1BSW2_9BURK|nr:dethiobiotin synthase [Oxalobacteraceae bacterium R-40]